MVTLGLVLLLIVFKGPNGDEVIGNVVRHYTEETSASIVPTENKSQIADIASLMENTGPTAYQDQGGSGAKQTPSIYTIKDMDSTIQAIDSVSTDYLDTFKADQVVKYTVQSGENIGSIASDFGVSINTVIWANNIKNPDILSLGEVLKIPPVTGVIHTIQNKDTVASIANKYKADSTKILSFNDLTADQPLKVGDELMVPDGERPGPQPSVKSVVKAPQGHGIYVSVGDGQCVPFVQAHGFSKMHGNANQWAKYINVHTPTSGGVVVLKGGKYGHVALITAVKANSIQVVEQNYYGPYIIDHREISLNDRTIIGFIQ